MPQLQAAAKLTYDRPGTNRSVAQSALNSLRVATAGSMTGYSASLFPARDASAWGWPVAPSQACDLRGAALYRDGVRVSMVVKTCTVNGGRWLDPYTAAWFTDPTKVGVDHVVPLAAAWRSGAALWTADQRIRFANDRIAVVAAGKTTIAAKGGKTPDAWKPSNQASQCLYAQRWIAVKGKYQLTVTPAEKAALAGMLKTCAEPVNVYMTPGQWRVNNRNWATTCEKYSITFRCRTNIWATKVTQASNGTFSQTNAWVFNNLTYLPSKPSYWKGNPLGNTGAWTDAEGRRWRTECNTPNTGFGCRTYIYSRVIVASIKPGGGYNYNYEWRWVFNNIVSFN